MCMKRPNITPAPEIVTEDNAVSRANRDRRIRLGQQTGGQLATRVALGAQTTAAPRVTLGQ